MNDERLDEAADLLAGAPRLKLDPAVIDRTVARAKPRRWPAVLPAAAAAVLFGWLIWFVSQPAAMTPEEARAKMAEHAVIMETFARQAANLEGKQPELDLALLQLEWKTLEIDRRTQELAVIVDIVPEAKEYADVAIQFATIVEGSGLEPRDQILEVRAAARESLWVTQGNTGRANVQLSVPTNLAVQGELATYAVGRIHLYNGNYDEAGKFFVNYLEANPNGAWRNAAFVWIADSNTQSGQWEAATLNYYSALTESNTWGTDAVTLSSFQNACNVVGQTTVNGTPMMTYTIDALQDTLTRQNSVTIQPTAQEQILLKRAKDVKVIDALRKIEGLQIDTADNAFKVRAANGLIESIETMKEKP